MTIFRFRGISTRSMCSRWGLITAMPSGWVFRKMACFSLMMPEMLLSPLKCTGLMLFRMETFGLVMLEALACGTPVAAFPVRGPLDVLEQREQQRQDRTLGQARAQFDLVHAHGVYDLEVDTSLASPEQCAQQVIERLQSDLPPLAFRTLAGCA